METQHQETSGTACTSGESTGSFMAMAAAAATAAIAIGSGPALVHMPGLQPHRSHNRAQHQALQIDETRLPCGLLPSQVSDLLDRDITPDDYEMLLQLDEALVRAPADPSSLQSLSTVAAEEVLGETCGVCLHAFERPDCVAKLRCNHLFHQACIEKWLVECRRLCPLCGDEGAPAEAKSIDA